MSLKLVEQRAAGVLEVLAIKPVTMAASGRYRRSDEILRGVRYWSSSSDRARQDSFGVQFWGEGLRLSEKLREAFVRLGYDERNPQTNQVTYCKNVDRPDDGGYDLANLNAIRREIDGLLGFGGGVPTRGFVAFMQASPLRGVDLNVGDRDISERRDEI